MRQRKVFCENKQMEQGSAHKLAQTGLSLEHVRFEFT